MQGTHSFSIKNIFYDKTGLKLFYFRVTNRKNLRFTPLWKISVMKMNPTKFWV